MAVIIALGKGNDLGFMYFQLFSGLEGTDPGATTRNTPECGYNFASGKLTTSHIASDAIQLCAVAIKSFYIDIESMLFCAVLP